METVTLPAQYNYIEAYLTLRCPLKCSYCLNNMSGKAKRLRQELSAEQWAAGLNRIDYGPVPLTIGGGEPTQHKEFFELMALLRPDIRIDLLSNLEFNIDEFIEKTTPDRFHASDLPAYKSIRVSYHPEQMDAEKLIKKAVQLQEAGYSIGIFGINHPLSLKQNMEMAQIACNNRIFFFIKDFLGHFDDRLFGFYSFPGAMDGVAKAALCRTKELLIGPGGSIYRCHRDLYLLDAAEAVGKITDPNLTISDEFRPCHFYGHCNPCDVKLKTNRFLQMGHCSVEIQPLAPA